MNQSVMPSELMQCLTELDMPWLFTGYARNSNLTKRSHIISSGHWLADYEHSCLQYGKNNLKLTMVYVHVIPLHLDQFYYFKVVVRNGKPLKVKWKLIITLYLINTLHLLSPHGSLKCNWKRIIVFLHATKVISTLQQNAVASSDATHVWIHGAREPFRPA